MNKCKKSEINLIRSEIHRLNQDIKKSAYKPYKKEYQKLKSKWKNRLRECSK